MLAILYDIHGNLAALEEVLADEEAAGVERYLLGGDYAVFGPWPDKTVERLGGLDDAVWIRGNVDRWTAAPDAAPDAELIQRSITWCAEHLADDTVRELAALPEQTILDEVRYCHASPVSDVKSFRPDPGEELDGLESQVGDDEELGAGVAQRRLVFGHTHHAFRRRGPGGVELVNPGSVGLPWDGDPRAAWALLHEDGTLEMRRVEYDHDAVASAVRQNLGEWAETTARRIEAARFEP